jgi:pilus assembly protein CpaC
VRRYTTQNFVGFAALCGLFGVLAAPPAAVRAQVPKKENGQRPGETREMVLYVGQSEVVKAPWPIKRSSVTDPKVAQTEALTADQILLQGKSVGTTDLVLWSAEEEIWRTRVDVEMDLRRLKEQLARLFPGSALELLQNQVQGPRDKESQAVVVVIGTLRRSEDVAALHRFFETMKIPFVDTTTVAGVQQVLLRVRVAEANRTALRSLGINAYYTGTNDNVFFGSSTVGSSTGGSINNIAIGPASDAVVGLGNTRIDVPYQFNDRVVISPLNTMTLGFPRAELYFLLQALAENEYVNILAEPNLVAQSGEEADFLAGGEFPIPVVQGTTTGGGTSITIEYKEFGIRLRFRPMVLGDGAIRLYVAPEVSELTQVGSVEIQGFRVPALTTRRAATTLELHSGQTFSMAGLIDKSTSARVSRVPGIGDLPVVGALFRSIRYLEGETELVVLVTVDLVDPISAKSTPPLPGQAHRRPNDWEVYLCGQIEGAGAPRLSDEESNWLRKLGFEDLRGPGAWASYGDDAQENQAMVRPSVADSTGSQAPQRSDGDTR